jgi:hypothetical protein
MIKSWLSRAIFVVIAAVAIVFVVRTIASLGTDSEVIVNAETGEETYNIVSLLPPDAIPAINNPQFVQGAEADTLYHVDELVLGVEIDGDARAYSIPFLSGHEIVNDEVGGVPIAVTW